MAIRVAVTVGDRGPRCICHGGQPVFAATIGGGSGDTQIAAAGQCGGGHVACSVVAHGVGDQAVGDGFQAMLIGGIVGVAVSSASAGDRFDQVSAGIGVCVGGKPGSGDGDQIAVIVILHGLGRFPDQGNVVKIRDIRVFLVPQNNTDPFHGACGMLWDDGIAYKLPVCQIRVEGDIIYFLGIVRKIQRQPQTALLLLNAIYSDFFVFSFFIQPQVTTTKKQPIATTLRICPTFLSVVTSYNTVLSPASSKMTNLE